MARLRTKLLIDYYIGGMLQALIKPPVMLLGKILRRNHNLAAAHDVTFLKLLGGGSLVMAYPALLALRKNPAIQKLRLVASPQTAPFGRALGLFDEILILRDRNLFLLAFDSLALILRLFRTPALVDLEIHSRLSTVLSVLTMARNRIGAYTDISFWRRGLSTHLLYYNKSAPAYGFYDQIATLFNSTAVPFDQCIAAFRAHIAATTTSHGADSAALAIAPCCSDLGRERLLSDEQWLTILPRACDPAPRTVHLLGSRRDADRLARLAALLHAKFPSTEILTHAGELSLEQAAALLGGVARLLTIDSALLHLARLMGTPTSSYWGPTDPATRLKSVTHLDVIHYHRIACSPCVHIANVAPCQGNNICMQFAVNPACGLDENPIWLAEGALPPVAKKN